MKCKVLCYALKVAYPRVVIDIIIGKPMACAFIKRFGDIDGVTRFVNGEICGGFMWHTDGSYAMVLPEKYDAHVTFHECLHAATRIWYDAGADLEVPCNDEVLTYMMNYLVEQIEEIYNANQE